MALVIGALSCKDVPILEKFQCWENEELEVRESADGVSHTYKAISLMPSQCCWFNEAEEWRECDTICILKVLLSSDMKNELKAVLTSEAVLVLISPFPLLLPHGLTLITDAPECLLDIWVNTSRAKEAESILNLKLSTLLLQLRDVLGESFVPESIYFDITLSKGIRERFSRGFVTGNASWINISMLKYNYFSCLEFLENVCRKEEDKVCLDEIAKLKQSV
uniref:Uncharacterized protein n=1 Tax=Ignisphaera aggregans TaxID=334771 RepID=A0A7J3Z6C3_9CREN